MLSVKFLSHSLNSLCKWFSKYQIGGEDTGIFYSTYLFPHVNMGIITNEILIEESGGGGGGRLIIHSYPIILE